MLTFDYLHIFKCGNKKKISSLRPGLSGIGSIVFRNEEDLFADEQTSLEFYKRCIAPYKGALESWYEKNECFKNYLLLILLTVWVVFRPKSLLVWRIFKDLPRPSGELRQKIKISHF